jgi:hypothetical protein
LCLETHKHKGTTFQGTQISTNMTMEEYENKFLEMLRYESFIKEEKVKIQMFLSEIPSFYKDKIQFDEPKNLEETIGKTKYLYE